MDDAITIPVAIIAAAAFLSVGLILLLRPLFRRYALARPNARSSHKVPTRQGGGIAVVGATIAITIGMLHSASAETGTAPLAILFFAVLVIGFVGVIADIYPNYVVPRF